MTAATNSVTRFTPGTLENWVDELTQRIIGKPVHKEDTALNDSDKKFTVPSNVTWEPLSIWVELTSDANAGNRQMTIQFQDAGDDVIGEVRAGAVQAASKAWFYMFGQGLTDLTGFRDTTWIMTPLPKIVLFETCDIRIYDSAAIAATTDDMVMHMLAQERYEI